MKTVTRLAIASLMMVLGLASWSYAQTPVKVTFRVNTSTLIDTLRSVDIVQMRGAIQGKPAQYNGQVIDWNAESTLIMDYVGDNTWEMEVLMTPGDTFEHKYWIGTRNSEGAIVATETGENGGWEPSDNRLYTLPANATTDVLLPVTYFANRTVFSASHPDTIQVQFRVNVGRMIQDGLLNPDNSSHLVQVRGGNRTNQANGEVKPITWNSDTFVLKKDANPSNNVGVQFYSGVAKIAKANFPSDGKLYWKFAIDRGSEGVTWEDGNDKELSLVDIEGVKSMEWSYFNGLRPTNAKRINTSFIFAIQVGALEDLGYFDAALGDSVFVASDFTGWATERDASQDDPRLGIGPAAGAMTYESAIGAWSKSIASNNVAVESTRKFKYYIGWAKSRFVNDPQHPNYVAGRYIPGLAGNSGYEEPGQFGGSDRLYTVVDADEQLTFNIEEGISYFNGIPTEGFISESNVKNGEMTLRFSIDMNPAKLPSGAARVFNPAQDSVFIHFETKFFAFTQGTIPGDNGESVFGYDRGLDSYRPTLAELKRIQLSDGDGDGIYTLDFPLTLPTLNDIGFRIVYGKPLSDRDNLVIQQGGFDPGRRYYQYIRPWKNMDGSILWPETFIFPTLTWAYSNLAFEAPTNYAAIPLNDSGDFSDLPEGYALSQNYPNPFNPSTTINFTLPVSSEVRLSIYNTLGQRVATVLNNQRFTTGTHAVNFDASRLASGVYIYRLEANNFKADRKMVLIK